MGNDLDFTGERYVPGAAGEIAHEHWHRYAFARRFVAGRRVLDAACGEGYGSGLLAHAAASVVGVDVDATTLAHARSAYADRANLSFVEASVTRLPLGDACVDIVVSFETIEHLPADAQPRMLAEFARVLVPDGLLLISSPNRPQYSEARGYANPFHLHELDRGELDTLLRAHFPALRWHRQCRYLGSALWAEEDSGRYEALAGTAQSVDAAAPPDALYFVVAAARSAGALPAAFPALSLYTDRDNVELARIDHEAREVLRLDGELRDCNAELRSWIGRADAAERALAERIAHDAASPPHRSPIPVADPGATAASSAPAATADPHRRSEDLRAGAGRPVDIVVAVAGDVEGARATIASVRASTSAPHRLRLVVAEAERPAFAGEVTGMQLPAIEVVDHGQSGRVAGCNRGIAASRADVVLLACGALVGAGWLDALVRCTDADPSIATVTAFSNVAGVCSFPRFFAGDRWPQGLDPAPLRRALAGAAPTHPDVPAGGGACMLVRRAAIDEIGALDLALDAEGSEQADLCLRAARAGWRNVLADDVLAVVPQKAASVTPVATSTPSRTTLVAATEASTPWRRQMHLRDRYPHYAELIERYAVDDPLRPLRDAATSSIDRDEALPGVLHIVHHHGGGTEANARTLMDASRGRWRQYLAIAVGDHWQVEQLQHDGRVVDFDFRRDPAEAWADFFAALCATFRIDLVHLHNISACREGIIEALDEGVVPFGYTVHSLNLACPTITLLDPQGRYCGAQTDALACQSCLDAQPAFAGIDIGGWRRAHARLMAKAAFVIAPSQWAAQTFRRYFALDDIAVIAHGVPPAARSTQHGARLGIVMPDDGVPVVAMLGAIGPDKGARRVEGMVELARARAAPVRFVVIGYLDVEHGPWQSEDAYLTVHGRYASEDLPVLLAHYGTRLVLFPSAGPETFCFTLTEAWQAGLPVLVPPVGALAERFAAHGAGWTLDDDEWASDERMLDRVLTIVADDMHDERTTRSARARAVPVTAADAMADATLARYQSAIGASPRAEGRPPGFAASRMRDALGYRPWTPPAAVVRNGSMGRMSLYAGAAPATGFRQTMAACARVLRRTALGRIVERAVPASLSEALKARLFR